jgi:ribosomal protein L12E/L44/L45/RPP1/RPP2
MEDRVIRHCVRAKAYYDAVVAAIPQKDIDEAMPAYAMKPVSGATEVAKIEARQEARDVALAASADAL